MKLSEAKAFRFSLGFVFFKYLYFLFSSLVATSESTAIEIILRHSKLISEAIHQRVDLDGLAPGEAQLTEAVKEVQGDALGAGMVWGSKGGQAIACTEIKGHDLGWGSHPKLEVTLC